jgi:hypothetical protein
MSADNKTGLEPGDASEIEDVTRTAGHDAEGEMTNSGDAHCAGHSATAPERAVSDTCTGR